MRFRSKILTIHNERDFKMEDSNKKKQIQILESQYWDLREIGAKERVSGAKILRAFINYSKDQYENGKLKKLENYLDEA